MLQLLVNIDVGDLERGVRFYTEGLGLRLRRRLGPGIAELEGAACPVFLLEKAPGSAPVPGGAAPRRYERHWTPIHLDFVVDDLDAAVRRATTAGALQEGEIGTYAWGRLSGMADPFGNGFCILELQGRGYGEIV